MKQSFKTIGVTHEVYQRLEEIGKFGESFNDVIARLLESAGKGRK